MPLRFRRGGRTAINLSRVITAEEERHRVITSAIAVMHASAEGKHRGDIHVYMLEQSL